MKPPVLRTVTTAATALVAAVALTVGAAVPSGAGQPTRGADVLTAAGIDASTLDAFTPSQRTAFEAIASRLPADWLQRRDAALASLGTDRTPVQEALEARVAAAIDGSDYVCGPTALNAYVNGLVAQFDLGTLVPLLVLGVLDYPTYDAILHGTAGDPAYALPKAYRGELSMAFKDTQRFWDVDLTDVQQLAMHGTMLGDVDRVSRTVAFVFGVDPVTARAIAEQVVALVAGSPAAAGGDNPIFTLNAFAFTGEGDPDPVVRALPDKMVFGDGLLAALEATGVGDVGPRAVLGHEMAHHVQYEAGLVASDLTGAEATRRTELMADAFGTYFVTSKRGLALNRARVLEAERAFYSLGDCSFASAGHHGTPNQRLAAATWGADVARSASDQGHVLPTLTLDARFEARLPVLVAPDAP